MVDIEIDKVCRVCLQSHFELSLLFDEQNAVDGVCLSDMISECTMYRVRRHDEFPHLICIECIVKVQNAYRFKKQYETSHRKLITFLDCVHKDPVDIKPNVNDKSIQTDEIAIYPCEKCDEKFINYDKLKVHRTLAHKGTGNHCRICLKTFRSIGSLKNHIAVRHPEEGHTAEHVCSVCDKKFTRKNHVLRHMRAIHKMAIIDEIEVDKDDEDESADEIKTELVENETLNETEIDYGIIKQEAEVILSPKYEASFHEDNMSTGADFADTNPFSSDEDDQPLSSLKSGEKENSNDCNDFADNLESKMNLFSGSELEGNDLVLSHDYGNNYKKSNNSYTKLAKGRFQCTYCYKCFTKSSHVNRHFLMHTQEKAYACDRCNKRFARTDHLKRHLAYHTTEKNQDGISSDYNDFEDNLESKINLSFISEPVKEPVVSSYVYGNNNDKSLNIYTKLPNGRFKCTKCFKCFTKSSHANRHFLAHTQEKAHACDICNKRFARTDHLKRHLVYHSTKKNQDETSSEKMYACTLCNKRYGRAYHLKRHLTTHGNQEKQAHISDILYINFHSPSTFHMLKTEHKDRNKILDPILRQLGEEVEGQVNSEKTTEMVLVSEKQDSETLTSRKLNNQGSTVILPKVEPSDSNIVNINNPNITTESYQVVDDNKYKCNECNKTFSRKSHVRRHLLSHKEDKPYACTVCDKRFGRADHLKVHVIKHHDEKPFPCNECDRKFSTSSLLKRHKLFKHDENRLERSEVCKICNKLFCNKNYLQKHMRLHTERGWKCKICLSQFESKESLKEHAKSHNKERPYLCSECGLRFLRNDYLLVHMRRHNGEKPYKCKYCDKRFPRTTDLNVHERYHTGEKTHLCTTCGKGFQRAYNLVVHMRVHTGERPYQCPSCPKNFAQCNDLKAHVRRHTGERYKCEICGVGFIQGYHLTQHKHTVHGIEMESRTGRVTKVSSNGVDVKILREDIVHENKSAENINLEQSLT